MDIGWKLRKFAHIAGRIKASIAIRGWRGTLRRGFLAYGRTEKGAITANLPVREPSSGHPLRRILVIDSVPPDPSRDSGSERLCRIFAILNQDGWQIDFVANDRKATTADIQRLAILGVRLHQEAIPGWLEREGGSLDAIMLCRLPIADHYFDLVRHAAPNAIILFDTVDLHFVRESRAARLTGTPALLRQARRSQEREIAMVRRCDVTLVVSMDELRTLSQEVPNATIELVSNIHDVHGRSQGFDGRRGAIFVGGFGHPPNEDAVRWFANEILPRIRAVDPGFPLHIAGDIDASSQKELESKGIIVHGRVADLSPLHAKALVSIAPLRFGAGVKGKVNLAMSHGLPVVVTRIAAEGMHLRHGVDALIADSPEDFASAIVGLGHDEMTWTGLSNAAMESVKQHFSAENARSALRRALGTSP
ncbi:glycosyltransferase family 4 protein [Luteibacter anthropi]|uniref:glycosyltransferase n=1 Tax=Luteibacter anthropi TaxID=564369 RepID=UPI002032CCD5|nr:glycosyltransferase [Luteibacter anthropi]URX63025.1 glycosyltransferase family 4 protein [Luteibacter anthropi]